MSISIINIIEYKKYLNRVENDTSQGNIARIIRIETSNTTDEPAHTYTTYYSIISGQ